MTCMPKGASTEIEEAQTAYKAVVVMKEDLEHAENFLMAKAMSMQLAGLVPVQTDPVWFGEMVLATELAGLTQRALMKR